MGKYRTKTIGNMSLFYNCVRQKVSQLQQFDKTSSFFSHQISMPQKIVKTSFLYPLKKSKDHRSYVFIGCRKEALIILFGLFPSGVKKTLFRDFLLIEKLDGGSLRTDGTKTLGKFSFYLCFMDLPMYLLDGFTYFYVFWFDVLFFSIFNDDCVTLVYFLVCLVT